MGGVLDLLAPYSQSFAFDELEQELKEIFIKSFNDLYGDIVTDIHHYGMPHLGSPNVVERFTKQDGLAVIRRTDASDKIMRVIYSNWRSLASKRGLAFLEFVLQMLWQDQWEIKRLYHSIDRADLYPTATSIEPTDNSFLTSRITISLRSDINFTEVVDLAPTLYRLVPANVVVQISSEIPLSDFGAIGVGMAMMPHMTANMFTYHPMEGIDPQDWSDWIILRDVVFTAKPEVVYKAIKSNIIETLESTATKDISPFIVSQLHKEDYRAHNAVNDAITLLIGDGIGFKWDVVNQRIIAHRMPANPNLTQACQVLLNRFNAYLGGGNEFFTGYQSFLESIDRMGWVVKDNVIYEVEESPETAFKSGDYYSTVSFIDAFNQNIQNQIINNPDLNGAILGDVEILSQTDTKIEYIQHYTKLEIEPTEPAEPTEPTEPAEPTEPTEPTEPAEPTEPTEPAEPTEPTEPTEPAEPTEPTEPAEPTEPTEPTMIEVAYQLVILVEITQNPEFDPDFGGKFTALSNDIVLTLFEQLVDLRDTYSDQAIGVLLNQALKDAYSEELTGVANNLYQANLYYFSFSQIGLKIIGNLNGLSGPKYVENAKEYATKIAHTVFEQNPQDQIIKYSDLSLLLTQNQSHL